MQGVDARNTTVCSLRDAQCGTGLRLAASQVCYAPCSSYDLLRQKIIVIIISNIYDKQHLLCDVDFEIELQVNATDSPLCENTLKKAKQL